MSAGISGDLVARPALAARPLAGGLTDATLSALLGDWVQVQLLLAWCYRACHNSNG